MRWVSLLLMVGCVGPEAAELQRPPPPVVALTVPTIVQGQRLVVDLDLPAQLRGTATLRLLASGRGLAPSPRCGPSYCTDLRDPVEVYTSPPMLFGTPLRATLAVPDAVPVSGRVWFQVVVSDPSGRRLRNPPEDHPVLLANDDADADGLRNGFEVSRGYDPLDPDSDGGGTWDGEEFWDFTDPLDPSDDLGTGESFCGNGGDDDGDGLVDCADDDCAALAPCAEVSCGDGADDDGDGLVDCADDDCAGDAACPELDCADGVDDDGDGLVDCEDGDCMDAPACVEVCGNGLDDDGDGLVDCADDACWGPGCQVSARLTGGRTTVRPALGPLLGTSAGGCVASSVNATLAIDSVQGELRASSSGAPGAVCTWTADRLEFWDFAVGDWFVLSGWQPPDNLQMGPGCDAFGPLLDRPSWLQSFRFDGAWPRPERVLAEPGGRVVAQGPLVSETLATWTRTCAFSGGGYGSYGQVQTETFQVPATQVRSPTTGSWFPLGPRP